MKRMTSKNLRRACNDPWDYCGLDSVCKRDCFKPEPCKIPKLIDRLAAYEDTGLEPEEIIELKARIEALEEYRSGRPIVWYTCTAGNGDGHMCNPNLWLDCDMVGQEADCTYRSSKPEGIAVELTDGVLRILDWMVLEGIQPEEAMDRARAARETWAQLGDDLPEHLCKGGMGDLAAELHLYISMAYRNWLNGTGKGPIATRMALVILRIQEWAEEAGVDLEQVLREKFAYNKTRPYRHGGKAL